MPHQWSWQLLRAGTLRLDGGGMFGVVPRTLWSKLATPDQDNRIMLQTNCLLLDDGSQKILIETGFGNKWTDKERGFYELERRTVLDALAEINIDPGEIKHVIVSHLHFDHAGGLTRVSGTGVSPVCTDTGETPVAADVVPSFPNATVHSQKIEWEDALANKSTMTRTYLRSHLDPVADRIQLADGEKEILPGVRVRPMPGHTWGQQAVIFNDERGTVCFPGDVLPTVNHVGLAFSIGYDMEPYTNMLSKRALLTQAAANGWRIAIDHEPDSPVVTVVKDAERDERFTLVPQPVA